MSEASKRLEGVAASEAAVPRIEIYSGRYCGYCVRAKQLLKARGLGFVEHDVDGDPQLRRVMLERSGGRRTVPQIFIDGRGIGGFAELYQMDRSGELAALLQGNGSAATGTP